MQYDHYEIIVPVLNKNNPTDPASYRDVGSVKGMPLNWKDDITNQMQPAVLAFLDAEASPEELRLVIIYIQHHIHAPCWLETYPFDEIDDECQEALQKLRERSLELKTQEDVNQYIHDCLEWGIDPL